MKPSGLRRGQSEVARTTRGGGVGKYRLERREVGERIRAPRARGDLRARGRRLPLVEVCGTCRERRDDREIVSGVCGRRGEPLWIGHVEAETGSVRARFRIIPSLEREWRRGADRVSSRRLRVKRRR